ncbi:MAG: GntR family transcriptional regulator [Muribaculaceae bacterium]|nr:GntR family transcriptional regulator [Muribaculaceae bacterium]
MKIGQYNRLTVKRFVDFGLYLIDDEGNEVLLPARYIDGDPVVGDQIDVFVYTDSEDRPVATTDHPYATVGEVAFLQVAEVSRIGAFLDWGLPKDLLVPFKEQRATMRRGGLYPVYVYLDHASGRVVGSAKIEKFLGNTLPRYKCGQAVKALVLQHTEIGYKAVVDNMFMGMIYDSAVYSPLTIGQTVTAYIGRVRPDGKIDLTLSSRNEIDPIADRIMEYVASPERSLPVDDNMSPEAVKELFGCSKRLYKQALGALYKSGRLSKKQ